MAFLHDTALADLERLGPDRQLDADAIAADARFAGPLRAAIDALSAAVPAYRALRAELGIAPLR